MSLWAALTKTLLRHKKSGLRRAKVVPIEPFVSGYAGAQPLVRLKKLSSAYVDKTCVFAFLNQI